MGALNEVTHGTGVPIEKEFAVDMRDTLYRLDPAQNPFLVFLNMFPKVTAYNTKYEWLEREGMERRNFQGKFVVEAISTTEYCVGLLLNGRDWNAIATVATAINDIAAGAPGHIRMWASTHGAGETPEYEFVGYIKRSALSLGRQQNGRKLVDKDGVEGSTAYFNMIQLTTQANTAGGDEYDNLINTAHEADIIYDEDDYDGTHTPTAVYDASDVVADDGTQVDAFVTIEFPNIHSNTEYRGHKEGSGLGKEVKKISFWHYNYTQIFKDPVSVTGTQDACRMVGGSERMKRQLEVGRSHASDLEWAIIFQGGGTEGIGGDWGIVEGGDNPRRIFKGLGVGHASGKEGFIVSNNGNPLAGNPGNCSVTEQDTNDYINFMEQIYDDQKMGTQNKVMFTSTYVIKDLSLLALDKTNSPFTLNLEAPYAAAIGLNVRRVVTPFGTLDLVLHPMFAGRYRRYGLVVDMPNINLRPLNGRDTKLHLDVASKEIDGLVDEYRTEMGIEVRHEHTHAIMYLSAS